MHVVSEDMKLVGEREEDVKAMVEWRQMIFCGNFLKGKAKRKIRCRNI